MYGNRGRPPANRTPEELRQQILAWVEERYADFNDTHLAEILAEREGICIGRETLRSLLRDAHHRPKRKRRSRRHHRRRGRSAEKGLMTLWDGSPDRWLGDEQPAIILMAAVDDADGELLAAFFVPKETSEDYLRLLQVVLLRQRPPAPRWLLDRLLPTPRHRSRRPLTPRRTPALPQGRRDPIAAHQGRTTGG